MSLVQCKAVPANWSQAWDLYLHQANKAHLNSKPQQMSLGGLTTNRLLLPDLPPSSQGGCEILDLKVVLSQWADWSEQGYSQSSKAEMDFRITLDRSNTQ